MYQKSPQYSPHEHILIKYSTHDTTKYATAPGILEKLEPKDTKYVQ